MKLNSIFMVFTFLILGSLSAQPKVDEQGRPIVSPIPVARPISGLAPESVPIPVPRPENLGREWHDASDPESGDADAALEEEQDFSGNPDGQADYSAELYQAVLAYDGTRTDTTGELTNHGTRACAWAANEVYESVFGHSVANDFHHPDVPNNWTVRLRTQEMQWWLESEVIEGRAIEVPIDQAKPGDMIISPTEGSSIGHVGYIGEGDLIYSNSSFGREQGDVPRFIQNYDRGCWQWAFSGANQSACSDPNILARENQPGWPKSLTTRVYRFLKDE